VLFGFGFVSLLTLCMLVYCLLDVVTTPSDDVRNLAKPLWLMLVLLFPLVGGAAWLLAGRPVAPVAAAPSRADRGVPAQPERPPRAPAASPDDEAEFLRRVRERAEAQRRRAAEQRQDGPADDPQRRLDDGSTPQP
jgi:hypothetical protein